MVQETRRKKAMPKNTVAHPDKSESIENWHVLVVDDQRDNLELTAAIIRSRGAKVTLVDNAREALLILETMKPTVILTDLAMPDMNGWELLRNIRANDINKNTPVIACSVRLSLEDEKTATEAGFDGYISKPFSIGYFIEKMKQVIAH
jgi:CheY-like chemotaxis protein